MHRTSLVPRSLGLALAAVVAILALALLPIRFGSVEAQTPSPPTSVGREAQTVFVDVGPLSQRRKGAERLTELHGEMAHQGWTVVSVETYIENGDLEGFFVTYVRGR